MPVDDEPRQKTQGHGGPQRSSQAGSASVRRTSDPGAETVDLSSNAANHPPPEASPARKRSARYVVGEKLGEGGMAIVNEAWDKDLHRTVAVKRLRPERADSDVIRARFFAEARLMATLEHPGTVPVFDAGALENGESYFAMRRVKGRTLLEILKKRCETSGIAAVFDRPTNSASPGASAPSCILPRGTRSAVRRGSGEALREGPTGRASTA